MKRLTNSKVANATKAGLFLTADDYEEIEEAARTRREPSFSQIYCRLAEHEDLLDILIKVGIKDYIKEIIYRYELTEDEQKLLEDFIINN